VPAEPRGVALRAATERLVRLAQTLRQHADVAERRALTALQLLERDYSGHAADDVAAVEDALRGLAANLPAALSAARELRGQLDANG
jgi:hypothetical protein